MLSPSCSKELCFELQSSTIRSAKSSGNLLEVRLTLLRAIGGSRITLSTLQKANGNNAECGLSRTYSSSIAIDEIDSQEVENALHGGQRVSNRFLKEDDLSCYVEAFVMRSSFQKIVSIQRRRVAKRRYRYVPQPITNTSNHFQNCSSYLPRVFPSSALLAIFGMNKNTLVNCARIAKQNY